jgi:hypothetical protein
LFRKRTREEKIRKMRVLEAISAGLAVTAAAIIFAVISGGADTQLLFLSLLCCLVVAVYQLVNFSLGSTLQRKIEQSRLKAEALPHNEVEQLGSGASTTVVNPHSVIENTTKRLEAVPRKARH